MDFNEEDEEITAIQLALLIVTILCLVILIVVCSVVSARKIIKWSKTKTTNREVKIYGYVHELQCDCVSRKMNPYVLI